MTPQQSSTGSFELRHRKLAMRSCTKYGLFLLALIPQICAAQHCSQDSLHRSAEQVRATQNRLLAVKVGGWGMDMNIAPPTQREIEALKSALAAAADDYMQCKSTNTVNVKLMETELAELLGANKTIPAGQASVETIPEIVDRVYGDALHVSVSVPTDEPHLLAVKISFEVQCGADTMLLLFDFQGKTWRQVIRWRSYDYVDASGAFGDFFEYVFLHQGPPKHWLVAVAHGHPWCTSRWSGFGLDVLAPSRDGDPQRVLFHEQTGYVRDTFPTFKPMPDGFELRYKTGSLDPDVMIRPAISRYRVVGDQVGRVQPIAENGRDFVDEWLQTKWTDSKRWSELANASKLEEIHSSIARLRDPKSKNWTSFSYGAVRGCSGNSTLFQVELDQDPGSPLFFRIREGNNSFTMISASPKPDPKCTGHDLMQSH